jgi:hypothetical protein
MATFPLKLQQTYLDRGYFNVTLEYDRYVRNSSGPVRLRLSRDGPEIEAKVNRSANKNGTARILGGVALRDWFQKNCELMDTVDVDLSSQEVIVLDKALR